MGSSDWEPGYEMFSIYQLFCCVLDQNQEWLVDLFAVSERLGDSASFANAYEVSDLRKVRREVHGVKMLYFIFAHINWHTWVRSFFDCLLYMDIQSTHACTYKHQRTHPHPHRPSSARSRRASSSATSCHPPSRPSSACAARR